MVSLYTISLPIKAVPPPYAAVVNIVISQQLALLSACLSLISCSVSHLPYTQSVAVPAVSHHMLSLHMYFHLKRKNIITLLFNNTEVKVLGNVVTLTTSVAYSDEC